MNGRIEKNDRCCGESGTLAVTRPDISTQVRFRKEEEMQRAVAAIRAGSQAAPAGETGKAFDGDVKILTACPSCLQGLARYQDDVNVGADYIVVEIARNLLGAEWMADYVKQANRGGIERVLV